MIRSDLMESWEEALRSLEKKISKHSYDTWLKSLKPWVLTRIKSSSSAQSFSGAGSMIVTHRLLKMP